MITRNHEAAYNHFSVLWMYRCFRANRGTATKRGSAAKLETSAGNDFVFEKIIFQTSECFGACSEYYLVLDSSRYFKLHAPVVYSKTDLVRDVSREGYFEE